MPSGSAIQRTSADLTTSAALHNQQSRRENTQISAASESERSNRRASEAAQPKNSGVANPNIDLGELEAALAQLNTNISLINERYSFQVDQRTDQLFVQVKDQSGEVLRQIPPESILRISSDISKMIGLFLDEIA